jgi:hypothetical protein
LTSQTVPHALPAVQSDHRREEHADDAQRLLDRLREVGEAGITTGELIREGSFGLRPPNRVGDLRRQGHLIETIREGNGVFRFRLIREAENPIEQRPAKKKATQNRFSDSADWYEKQTGRSRPRSSTPARANDAETLPLFEAHRG